MSPDQKDQVAQWLRKSGFPLEMRVAAEWEKAGFDVSQSVYYIDPETEKARETDIVASKENLTNDAWLRFFCVVECKSAREPWVLFPRCGSPLQPRSRILSLAASPLTSPYVSRIARRLDITALKVFSRERRPAYGMVQANSEKTDHAYAALMSVSKASAVLLEQLSQNSAGEDSFELLWPLIVTEAPLFEAELSAAGELRVEPIERGTLMWRHPTAGRGIAAIDVVHANAAATLIGEIKDAVDLILWNTESESAQALVRRKEHAAKRRPPTA